MLQLIVLQVIIAHHQLRLRLHAQQELFQKKLIWHQLQNVKSVCLENIVMEQLQLLQQETAYLDHIASKELKHQLQQMAKLEILALLVIIA